MAFERQSSKTQSSDNAANKNKVGGYLNINIITGDGARKRLGGSGIQLREGHPLEAAILKFCRENPDRVQDLVGRIELTYGEATPEGTVLDLGL